MALENSVTNAIFATQERSSKKENRSFVSEYSFIISAFINCIIHYFL